MEIKEIEKILTDALREPDNTNLQVKYCDAITKYLKDNKSSEEILSIVIRGVDIDRAANYFDYLENVSKNDLEVILKQIRKGKKIKEIRGDYILKFLSGMFSMALMKVGNLESQCGNIITLIVATITAEKKPIPEIIYTPILQDYVLDDLDPKTVLPKWEAINIREEVLKEFAEIVLKIADGDNSDKYKSVRMWANRGMQYADEKIKKKKIEEKIPQSRISDLEEIVAHYRSVEIRFRKSVYQEAQLEEAIDTLNKEIADLHREKHELEGQIRALYAEIETMHNQLEKAKNEVGERAAINEAFEALKKNDETALLKDIAIELKAEYQDFVDSASDEMDEVLGEIYREKLKNIFKILNKKGITME